MRSSREDANLFLPTYKNQIGENSLKLTGALWNKLPVDIKNSKSYKKKLVQNQKIYNWY